MDKELFKENVYRKYQKNKSIKNDEFFNSNILNPNTDSIYKITKIAATVILCFATTAGVVYGGTELYKYITQKPISPKFSINQNYDYSQDMEYKDKIYYKKINNYTDYQKYKNMWSDLLDMSESDFKENFMLITAIENNSMLGFTIINTYADDSTLFIEFNKDENADKNNTVIGTKISNDLYRENIEFKEKANIANSDDYTKITEIQKDYSLEDALVDNCFVIKNNKIISKDAEKLNNFISETQKGNNSFIRIYSVEFDGRTTVRDIEYRDNKYIFNVLTLSGEDDKIFSGEYTKIEKRTSKSLGTFVTLYKDDSVNSEDATVCIIQ